ncbi:MAG TPA: Zn-ribbon domain-containing OB-fold protein [Amycolatopsis sp.]|nr:Zn-ribbon domain-containing OB-fold protein [Amycolatopsis sp.]
MTEQSAPPLRPLPDELTQFFWDGARDHKLMIQRCSVCGTYQHPPDVVCHACLSFDLGAGEVSGRGTVYTYSMSNQAFHPSFADKLPYCIAVVELPEQPGLKLLTNVVDLPPDGVSVGDPVEVTFQDLGDDMALPVFRVVKP